MDPAILKTLLDNQNQAYRDALEIFLKQNNENFKSLQVTVNDLKCSLEFTQKEVEDLKAEVKKNKQERKSDIETIKKLEEDLKTSNDTIEQLENRANYMEDYSRRNNLQIVGLEERPDGENWEQTTAKVNNLLEEKLQIPNLEIERAHRVGSRDDHRPRPIVARFTKFEHREAVMRNLTKLRGTRIFVNEDLCPASQRIRAAQLPQMKQARSEGKIAFFRHTRLIIKERLGGGAAAHDVGPQGGSSGPNGAAEPSGRDLPGAGDGDSARVNVSAAGAWAKTASPAASQTALRTTRAATRGGKK